MDNKPKHRKPKSTSKSPSHIKKPSKTIHKASPHHSTNLRNSIPHTSTSPTPPAVVLDITEKLTNSTIYCRDIERKHITDFINNDKIKTIFISGQPGTGKTSLLLDIFSSYTCSPKPKTKLIKHYIKVTMNCMSMTTTTDFYSNIFISLNNVKQYSQYKKHLSTDEQYTQLINSLDTNEPSRDTLFQVLSILYTNNIGMFILLDEIDSTLDTRNRAMFLNILEKQMESINSEQVFLITHNNVFENFPVDLIVTTKNKDINYTNANIIWSV